MHSSFVVLAAIFILMYLIFVRQSNKRFELWPVYKIFFFVTGVIAALVPMIDPLAALAHHNFTYHMIGHLLLGMLAPLLLVLSSPVTLLLRLLSQQSAKLVTSVMRGKMAHFFLHPVIAAGLNIGGLWVLYMTPLYMHMLHQPLLHLIVHWHVFAAGYLFTLSILYTEPVSSRKSYRYRAIVLIITMAGHGILSKMIYANPPSGAETEQAQSGAMVMYYGGDLIDLMLVILLCWQWYQAAAPRFKTS